MFFKRLVLLLCLLSIQANALNYFSIEIAGGKLIIKDKDKDVYNFGVSTGWNDEENKMFSGITYKHIGTGSVADTIGLEVSKGFNLLIWRNSNAQLYPFVKLGVGVSFVDFFSDEDDYTKRDDQKKVYVSDDKQKKAYVSAGAGLNLAVKRKIDMYISYDRLFLFPMRDHMSVGSFGVIFKF